MRFFTLFLCFLFFIGACNHNSKSKELKTAQFYFEKANHYKNRGDEIKALEYLSNIRKKFFYSSYSKKALLMTADIYFDQEKYQQAVQTYKKYKLFYSENQDYVLYQLGLSYKNQLPNRVEHDLSLTAPALSAFEQLIALKGDSTYKKKALKARQEILDKKAERELKIALFFKTQGWDKAGLKRIQYFIKHYPNSLLMPQALLAGFELAKKLNQNPEEFKKRLLKKYPKSPEVKSLTNNSFLILMRKKLL